MNNMDNLIDQLIREGYLKTPLIIEAFKKIDRKDFVIDEFKEYAYVNEPLPIGYGQTISQPLTVAFILELLQPMPGDRILDIGSGSGWQTALLAYIVSQKGNPKSKAPNPKHIPNPNDQNLKHGKAYAIERIPELVEFGKKNVAKYNFIDKGIVEMAWGDGSLGWPNIEQYPELGEGFDKIICAASAEQVSKQWKEQLKINGRIVTPIKNSIWLFIKKDCNEFEQQEFPGFAFVPLIKN
jgi:protein-L-isoaspartate(D-aspartate) O-methyltransferase